jgi:hypothetical protein
MSIVLCSGNESPAPTLPFKPYNDPTEVTVVEVKDLKQTIVIETGYGETNAWL